MRRSTAHMRLRRDKGDTMMYSEKLMELFKNPHNMGKIEDADAVGKVGNPVCLVSGSKIHLNDHLESIQNINTECNVLTHKGFYEKVLNTSKKKYNGQIIKFKNKLGEVSVTPDHLVFAVKVPKKRKFFDHKVKKELKPAWYHASDLEKRDIILYPVLKEIRNIKSIPIKIKKYKYDFKSFELPEEIVVDKDFLRLCGYFLAEGHVNLKITKSHLSFTFHIDEKRYYEDVIDIVKGKFNLEPKVKLKTDKKTAVVYVYSALLARFFVKLFNKGAKNKKIPKFMMFLPPEKQAELIKGLWYGDGYVSVNRTYPRAGYSTISYELINQIKIILLRLGVVPSIYTEEEKIRKGVKHQRVYRIHIGDKQSLRKLCKILGTKIDYNKQEKTHSWFENHYFYTPITSKKEFDYNGFVYNLEVDDAHSFTTDAFCVHNCGDMMNIYIKVKDNVIEDIKFETFGCAAAIATSSMVTDLAKGKTLDEAKKITHKDIADSLGGLPKIKLHCSALAIEGLHEAIKEYRKLNNP